ncbi:MAG: peptidoglycan editing factor PgeF [Polyangiaceae bacterium]|nr:peptidoglycan editing factor PgeF [Polyangiaceae bacterium]
MVDELYLQSPLLSRAGFRHAFFTRSGGVSVGPYRSLSFSVAAGDDPAHVAENRQRAAAALGVREDRLYYLSQVHGVQLRQVVGDEDPRAVLEWEGDALLSTASHVACGVRSADCVPVLIGDRSSGAACAVHAGWRGVAARIVPKTLEALTARLPGARFVVAIGPHISLDAFEVDAEVAEALARSCSAPEVASDRWPKPHVDLRRILRSQLEETGLEASSIDDVHGCTVNDPARFFSFRRDGKLSGRHLSAIVPLG